MVKVLSFILTAIMVLLPALLFGWAIYYMRVQIKDKRSRAGFLKGSRNDFINAVSSYEKIYSINTDTSTESIRQWKSKYKYLNEFINFNHKKLGLDKDFVKLIDKYLKYIKD